MVTWCYQLVTSQSATPGPASIPPKAANMSRKDAATAGPVVMPQLSEKTLYEAYILWIPPFGLLGGHHYYLRRYLMGVMYSLTLGFFGIGLIVDLFRMPMLVRQANAARYQAPKPGERSIIDAYLFLIPPLGLLGCHHFYLRRYSWGVAYLFTLGFFGLGFLFDLVYIPFMVKRINENVDSGLAGSCDAERGLASAYVLAFPPSGLLGCHQLYLQNYFMFGTYICTLGLFGVGWLVDIFRLPVLVRRWRERHELQVLYRRAYLDDAYLLLLPMGLLGMHHFYLRRYAFGVIYLFTLGLCGLGVLADIFLIPTYVKRCNAEAEAELLDRMRAAEQARQQRAACPYVVYPLAQPCPGVATPTVEPPPRSKAEEAGCDPAQLAGEASHVPLNCQFGAPRPYAAVTPPPGYGAAPPPSYGAIPPPYTFTAPGAYRASAIVTQGGNYQ